MGSGFSKMKKQARMMEQQFEKMREEMQETKVTGSSGNGLVSVVFNGAKEMLDITIKPECVDLNDLEGLQDLIKAACEDAHKKLADNPASGGMQMPRGLPFGF